MKKVLITLIILIIFISGCFNEKEVSKEEKKIEQEIRQKRETEIEEILNSAGTYEINYLSSYNETFIHYNDGTKWTTAPGEKLEDSTEFEGYKTITINATELEFVFNNGASQWDNNNNQNYKLIKEGRYKIQNGNIEEIYNGVREVKIHYLTSYNETYIHYNDGLKWTNAPGLKMGDSSLGNGYKYILVEASNLRFVFNNGGSIWDNNNGNDYIIAGNGEYKVENGNVTIVENKFGAPLGLQASEITKNSLKITWNKVLNSEGYLIYKKENNTFVQIADVSTEEYIDSNLDENTNYEYKIKAYNLDEESDFSKELIVKTKKGLDIPQNLVINDVTDNSIIIEWDDLEGVEGYKVERSISDDSNYLEIADVKKEEENIKLYYKSSWNSTYIHFKNDKNVWTNVPGNKMELSQSKTGYYFIEIESKTLEFVFNNGGSSWDNNGNKNYKITELGTFVVENGTINKINEASITQKYEDLDLQSKTTYYYRVKAYTGSEESSFSNNVFTTTTGGGTNNSPTKPIVILPIDNSINQELSLTLKWESEDVDGDPILYDIYLGDESNLELIESDFELSEYNVELTEFEKVYKWQIKAKDNKNGFSVSELFTFTTKSNEYENNNPSKPELLLPVNGDILEKDGIVLSYSSSDEDGDPIVFDIYLGESSNPELYKENITNSQLILDELKFGTKYYWYVVVKDDRGGVNKSDTISFITKEKSLDSPQNLSLVEIKSTSALIRWDKVESATSYDIYRAKQDTGEYDIIATKDISNGIKIKYESVWNNVNIHYNFDDKGWTTAPGEEMEKNGDYFEIEIDASELVFVFNNGSSWDNNSNQNYSITEKGIYRISNGKIIKEEETGDVIKYLDNNLEELTSYFYRIKAKNVDSVSEFSNRLDITTIEQELITIHYKNSWSESYGHYREIDGEWTTSPGIKMEESRLGSDFKMINIELSNVEIVFNNGSGIWDSNGGDSYIISEPGEYKIDNDEIVKIGPVGVFKMANSWGKYGWENVGDGFLHITYEAMKEQRVSLFIMEPKNDYEPKALAIFELDHPYRSDVEITIGVGDIADPIATKKFKNRFWGGGLHPFPENKIVFDITELLPVIDETIYISVFDKTTKSEVGILKNFSIEVYDDYSNEPISTYNALDLPQDTKDGETIVSYIPNVTAEISDNYFNNGNGSLLKYMSKDVEMEELKLLQENIGVYDENEDYYTGNGEFGTGLVPPTLAEWQSLLESGNLKVLEGEKLLQYALPPADEKFIDHSTSKYFPPIGSQGGEGACVSWSVGYYTATFYEARDNDWDLSNVEWLGKNPTVDYQDKIMSPEFLYHMVNNGRDVGSFYSDNIKVVSNIGISSWEKMPYSTIDHTSWPSEAAFREAPKYRNKMNSSVYYFLTVDGDDDVETVKTLLREGYLISASIDARRYTSLSPNDVWTKETYVDISTNHANTIVGYFDEFTIE